MFIYFVITISVTMWNNGQMAKVLNCPWKGEGCNLTLNILWTWIIMKICYGFDEFLVFNFGKKKKH
jgi:tryptophan-rich sensory protein